MLTSLVYLQQENVKKSKKLIKLDNTDEENFHIFQTIWGISMKLSGKTCLMIILKVTKKQSFIPPLENTVLEKRHGDQIYPRIYLNWLFHSKKKTLSLERKTPHLVFLRFNSKKLCYIWNKHSQTQISWKRNRNWYFGLKIPYWSIFGI